MAFKIISLRSDSKMAMKQLICFALLIQHSISVSSIFWKDVLASKMYIDVNTSYDPYYRSAVMTKYIFACDIVCAMKCERLYWCNSWCMNQNGTCVHSNAVISPLHITDSPDPYQCYTKQKKDFIVGATVTSSPPYPSVPLMKAENLVKGIYNFVGFMTCGAATPASGHPGWIVFTLNSTQTIREIRITTQSYPNGADLPNGATITVGTNPVPDPGQFGSYVIFGSLPSTTALMTTYSVKNVAQNVRYIAIQKWPVGGSMTLCDVKAF